MKDDYLWDGSGEPDPEIQKLEAALGRYRHNQPAPAFDRLREIRPVEQRRAFFSLRWLPQLGAVAGRTDERVMLTRFGDRPDSHGREVPCVRFKCQPGISR